MYVNISFSLLESLNISSLLSGLVLQPDYFTVFVQTQLVFFNIQQAAVYREKGFKVSLCATCSAIKQQTDS